MSAAIMLRQHNCIHLATDAAVYFQDGVVAEFVDKCRAFPEIRCAVTMLGASRWQDLVFDAFRETFTSFDDAKERMPFLLQVLWREHASTVCEPGAWPACDVWVIGWSDQIGGPDGFTAFMDDFEEWRDRDGANPHARPPFVVYPLHPEFGLNWHPHPTAEQLFEAKFPRSLAETEMLSDVDLLQVMEVQRRIPSRFHGHPIVGGYMDMTTVDRNGALQRRVHTWDDKVGELIRPGSIDWVKWRQARERAPSNVASIRKARKILHA
ncbi:hypothetical protein [Bradyrhizobium sp. CCBAU 53338]|uniref:hypothetical protein n=1 Tax=Bradyrhizobium sp. CCBAU 53338 TaxID=1325111 RepID=UPI00188D0511|nr:hypothetical protein [Bradyrhizobium sp. CCBAU 53338]QOZ52945.1 hypothetical protein XH90_17410 [Bradyrhizobium sp. CCBAU 53338]